MTWMRILESRRWRRRLLVTAVLLPILVLVYLGVHLSSSGNPENANGPVVPDYAQPKKVPFTPAEQRAVRPVLAEFIRTAVAGEDIPRAWDLVAPSLREGITRKQWNNPRFGIPVVPYPASHRGLGNWSFVQYSYQGTVGLEVYLFPKPGSGYSAMTADVELVKARDGRWLVDYWLPKKFHGPPAVASKSTKPPKGVRLKAAGKRHVPVAVPEVYKPQHAGRGWLAIPLAFFGLVLFSPVVIVLFFWIQTRRARREYLRSAS